MNPNEPAMKLNACKCGNPAEIVHTDHNANVWMAQCTICENHAVTTTTINGAVQFWNALNPSTLTEGGVEMTNEQMRVEIALALGWTNITFFANGGRYGGPVFKGYKDSDDFQELPNWPNDLNACHEMEKHLCDTATNDQWSKYCIELNKIACHLACKNTHECGYTISATAAQRCKAFLKAKGKL